MPRERVGDTVAGAMGVHGIGQPRPEAMGHVQALEPIDDDVVVEELALHELPEAAADLVLPVRDDRGVRDRNPERMAEQRGDREPVGQRTDHGRFRERPYVAHPGPPVLARPG